MCVASRRARSASEMQSCWLDNATFIYIIFFNALLDRAGFGFGHGHIRLAPRVWALEANALFTAKIGRTCFTHFYVAFLFRIER